MTAVEWRPQTSKIPSWLRPVDGLVRARLYACRSWVEGAYFPDLSAAVRWNVQQARERRRRLDEWQARQRSQAKINPRVRLAREALFSWPRRCHYCGARATQTDHVIPRCQDGSDDFDNLAAACARCNLQKGGLTPEQWRAWCAAKAKPWPPPGAVWTRDSALILCRPQWTAA